MGLTGRTLGIIGLGNIGRNRAGRRNLAWSASPTIRTSGLKTPAAPGPHCWN
jgi:hypothetical protein